MMPRARPMTMGKLATRRCRGGFTLLELVIVVAIVGILAAAVLPLTRMGVKRAREIELHRALRQLRTVIDAYHDAALAGMIELEDRDSGYPPDLEILVEGVEIVGQVRDPSEGIGPPPRLKFLRSLPIDPMTGKAEWGLRCYEDEPDARFWCRDDVFDVYSLSSGTAIDGSKYREW